MPYSTLDSIFKRGISNANVLNVIKICELLDIQTEPLIDGNIVENRKTNADKWIAENAIPVAVGRLPVLGSVSAGNGCCAYQDIIGYEVVDERYADDEHFFFKGQGRQYAA